MLPLTYRLEDGPTTKLGKVRNVAHVKFLEKVERAPDWMGRPDYWKKEEKREKEIERKEEKDKGRMSEEQEVDWGEEWNKSEERTHEKEKDREWEVEKITRERMRDGEREFRVFWKDTWEGVLEEALEGDVGRIVEEKDGKKLVRWKSRYLTKGYLVDEDGTMVEPLRAYLKLKGELGDEERDEEESMRKGSDERKDSDEGKGDSHSLSS